MKKLLLLLLLTCGLASAQRITPTVIERGNSTWGIQVGVHESTPIIVDFRIYDQSFIQQINELDIWGDWQYRTDAGAMIPNFTDSDYNARSFRFGPEHSSDVRVVVYRTRSVVERGAPDGSVPSGVSQGNASITNEGFTSTAGCIDALDDYDTYFRGLDRFEGTEEDMEGVVYYDFTETNSYIYLSDGAFVVESGSNRDYFNCAHEAYAEILTRN